MTQKKTFSIKTLLIATGGVLIVALLVGAVLFGGSTEQTGSPEVSGILPPMPASVRADQTATGSEAPTVVGADFDGNEVSIQNDGRPKAIVFLAHWCPHCQAEVPSVQAWLDATGGVEGVDMYSVATAVNSSRGNYPPSDWLSNEGWSVPVIRDDANSSVLVAHGNGGFPFWVFTNSDGTVALRIAGELPIADLEQIMGGLT